MFHIVLIKTSVDLVFGERLLLFSVHVNCESPNTQAQMNLNILSVFMLKVEAVQVKERQDKSAQSSSQVFTDVTFRCGI